MNILYLDCAGGVTPETLTGCLFELAEDAGAAFSRLQALKLPGAEFFRKEKGLGLRMAEGERAETLPAISAVERARRALDQLKGGISREALAWATACFALADAIPAGKIIASPVNLGSPFDVRAAESLRGKPVFARQDGRTSAAGAALLVSLAHEFGEAPVMTAVKCAACAENGAQTRALLGEIARQSGPIAELNASIDDMTPEALGFALECFFAAGAVEAYTAPLNMKKSRPGVLLTVMCPEARKQDMLREIFRHTTTIGVRVSYSERYALERETEILSTPLGEVRRKVSRGYGVRREKLEYEDLARLARETGRSLEEVRAAAQEGGKPI